MRIYSTNWKDLRSELLTYASCARDRREQLLFRGHADSNWLLQSTLDRSRSFASDQEREKFMQALLEEFRRETIRLRGEPAELPMGDAFDLLARHHGLPSPLLDWSASPYVAAYFAFEGGQNGGSVTIFRLDRAKLPSVVGISIVDDHELLRFNVRALQQRSVFLRISTTSRPVEKLLGDAVVRFDLPATDRELAMADLDEMGINATNLFRDITAAARTAQSRIMG